MEYKDKKYDPYVLFQNISKKIKKEWKIAILSTIVIGIITHLYIMVNVIPNHDSLYNIYATQNITKLGRWFLQYACGLSSYYSLPWVIGSISIVLISITSAIIVELFGVKKKLNIILLSGILVTFPTIASSFTYMYTMDGYMFALMFSALAVLLSYKYKYGFLLGAILICLSLGIYQSYVSVAILLCILKIMLSIINGNSKKELIIECAKDFAMGVLGFVLYYIILKIMLAVQNIDLVSYQGVNTLNNIAILDIPSGIIKAIKGFIKYPLNTHFFRSNIIIAIANIIIIILIPILYLKEYMKAKNYKRWFNNILLIVLVLAIPIGCNIVNVISKDTGYHLLMRYSWCLFYVGLIVLLERKATTSSVTKWAGIVSLVCIIFNFIIVTNISYFNVYYKFEKSYSLCFRISETIEEKQEYNKDIPVAIIGRLDVEKYPSTNLTNKITKEITGAGGDLILSSQTHYKNFFANYFNITINTVQDNEIGRLKKTEEFKKMENWPSKKSIQLINGVLVVKLSDDNYKSNI